MSELIVKLVHFFVYYKPEVYPEIRRYEEEIDTSDYNVKHQRNNMLVIKNTLVSLDLIERFFVCDLDVCLGQCCIDGDAGAPLLEEERREIDSHMNEILPLLNPQARLTIKEEGSAYTDPDGDLVTQIVEGRDCVYTCYAEGGKCLCALEKAFREGKLPQLKPSSCHLYPVRLKKLGDELFALNVPGGKRANVPVLKGVMGGGGR